MFSSGTEAYKISNVSSSSYFLFGMVKEKVDPDLLPSIDELSSLIEHPICVKILLQILRPIPVPATFKFDPCYKRSKGMNSFSLSSSLIPMPESITLIRI